MLKKYRTKSKDNNSSPAWMTTYGDMMTLLLVFFVLLYSFSVMDMEKFRDFVSSFQRQLGVLDSGKTITDENLLSRGSKWDNFNPEQENYIRQVMGELKRYIQEQGLQEKVKMDFTEKGFVVTVTGEVLYDLGKAVIKNKGQNLLNQIGERLIKIPNNIRVEGHTDNLPINKHLFVDNDSYSMNGVASFEHCLQLKGCESSCISPYQLSFHN
jgi:chemotaxis protein MotB